jgi:hypothetical protein
MRWYKMAHIPTIWSMKIINEIEKASVKTYKNIECQFITEDGNCTILGDRCMCLEGECRCPQEHRHIKRKVKD